MDYTITNGKNIFHKLQNLPVKVNKLTSIDNIISLADEWTNKLCEMFLFKNQLSVDDNTKLKEVNKRKGNRIRLYIGLIFI